MMLQQWHLNGKGSPFSDLTGDADLPAMCPTNLMYIEKAESKAFYIVDVAGGNAVELFKKPFLVLLGNTGAPVSNG